MNKIKLIIFALLIGWFTSNCSLTGDNRAELLAENLKIELINGNFESIYNNASDFVHNNTSKEDFVMRLKIITERAKTLNSELNWQVDNLISQKGPAGFETLENSNTFYAFRKIENGQDNIHFLIYWSDESGHPELFGLSAVSFRESAGNMNDNSLLNDNIAFQMDIVTGTAN